MSRRAEVIPELVNHEEHDYEIPQLQDNAASLDLELSAEQLKSLKGASQIELGFPQSIYEREMVRSIRYGGRWDRLLLCMRHFSQNRDADACVLGFPLGLE
jgi:hypothetical protein